MPRPPYSSGTIQPSSPSSPALRQASRLTTPASSHSAVCGTHSFSRKARTICRNCSCSSVKMVRRTGPPPAGSLLVSANRRVSDNKIYYITILAGLPRCGQQPGRPRQPGARRPARLSVRRPGGRGPSQAAQSRGSELELGGQPPGPAGRQAAGANISPMSCGSIASGSRLPQGDRRTPAPSGSRSPRCRTAARCGLSLRPAPRGSGHPIAAALTRTVPHTVRRSRSTGS